MDKKNHSDITDVGEIIRREISDILDVASEQFLIICSPGVKHISELKVVSSTCFNLRSVMLRYQGNEPVIGRS